MHAFFIRERHPDLLPLRSKFMETMLHEHPELLRHHSDPEAMLKHILRLRDTINLFAKYTYTVLTIFGTRALTMVFSANMCPASPRDVDSALGSNQMDYVLCFGRCDCTALYTRNTGSPWYP